MPRPPKTFTIPLYEDIKSIKTLQEEGYSQRGIADYYGVPLGSITRLIKKMREG
jgi:transposase